MRNRAGVALSSQIKKLMVCCVGLALFAAGLRAETERVSVTSTGEQGNNDSYYFGTIERPAISGSGRYVAYLTSATNLASNSRGIIHHDRTTGANQLINVSSDGTIGNSYSNMSVHMSADGRYVCFTSQASNLVPNDTNKAPDIFVRDTWTKTTTRVNVGNEGQEDNLGVGGGFNTSAISSNGQFVVFLSYGSNLVANDTNGVADIFVRDLVNKTTKRVSVSSSGTQSNSPYYWGVDINDVGSIVTFSAYANNLVPNDTNYTHDVFVHELATGTTTRVSVDSQGNQCSGFFPSISGDGRYVAFASTSTKLVASDDPSTYTDIYRHDRVTHVTQKVSITANGIHPNMPSNFPYINKGGRFITFLSYASNLASANAPQPQVYVKDMESGALACLSVNNAGQVGNGICQPPAISRDGSTVSYSSQANNLVAGDTNGFNDIFESSNPLKPVVATTTATSNETSAPAAAEPSGDASVSSKLLSTLRDIGEGMLLGLLEGAIK